MIFRPNTHPELIDALDFLHDSLSEMEIIHAQEQDEENPNLWTCAAYDDDGYVNTGFVVWDEDKQEMAFFAYDPIRANHDEAEGVPEGESVAWWNAKDADTFLLHLTGEVRDIIKKHQKISLQKVLDK